ncbi:TetR/AcrR family transcriptional regulator [Geodermatophilus nigrescens]|uniref:Transcriptional regulator, TetR family n=1 Tax=Geodermatophilus nigrescens TaxID=1070870 RepID=A0A1M5QZJ6_9ACTN|nr:TetR/AcrR family transcriptional regulator [Geodermatophilus nigrescens]SHH19597.1 transcriptional regulator, TetR family [Geodermatophilus nigrescens]
MTAPAPPPRSRRSAADRREQLVGIGLQLLPTTPVQELTIDEVARRAGISRSLLFHYFPSKRDYYRAVTRAAADLLRTHLTPPDGVPAADRPAWMLDRYVGWVETYRETHLAFVRGAAGGDPWVAEVYEETREALVDLGMGALGIGAPGGLEDPLRRQLVRSWFAFTEDLVHQWVREPATSREDLLALLTDVLGRLLDR